MPTTFPNGFLINNADPIDSRTVVSSSSERFNNLESAVIFNGLIVYQTSSQEVYVLVDKSNVGNSTGWAQMDIALSGSGLGLQETLEAGNSASLGMTASFLNVGNDVAIEKHSTQEYLVISGSGAVLENQASPTPVAGAIMFSGSFLYMGFPG